MKNDPVVAIAGVTGAVGAEFIATMDRRGFPRRQAEGAGERALGRQDASTSAARKSSIEELTEHSFDGVDIALFSAGSGISTKFARSR